MTGPTGGETTAPFGDRLTSLDPAVAAMVASLVASEKTVKRLVIAGVPKAGKTTIAQILGELSKASTVRHTDSLIETHGWSEGSAEVARWFDGDGSWIVEGVATVRALRKWMFGDEKYGVASHSGKPCDAVLWLPNSIEPIEGRVAGLAKGCHTVWRDIEQELIDRGVQILRLD